MSKLSVSIVQMDIVPSKPYENRKRALKLIDDAINDRPDIIMLPEMWTTAYELSDIDSICDNNGEPTISFIKDKCQQNDVNIISGSIANKINNSLYNTSYIVNNRGEVIDYYNKIHLFKLMDEHKYFNPGNKICVFEINGIKCGIIICYDLRFPELTRKIALEGIKILFVPAQWPSSRINNWETLLTARAIENQIFVIAANRAGNSDDDIFNGRSMMIDPYGQVIKKADYKEQIINYAIDLELIDKVKNKMDVFKDRITTLY